MMIQRARALLWAGAGHVLDLGPWALAIIIATLCAWTATWLLAPLFGAVGAVLVLPMIAAALGMMIGAWAENRRIKRRAGQ